MSDLPWSTAMLREIAYYLELLADEIDAGASVTRDDNRFVQSLCKVFWGEQKYPVGIKERKIIGALKNLWSRELTELKIEPHSNC